jgi:putative spermidine/putrescine transport system substrate-binding protein
MITHMERTAMKSLQRIAAAAISALVAAALAAGLAAAQEKSVRLISWGGSVQQTFEQGGLARAFEKDTGYKLVFVPKPSSPEIIATAIAQKDNPQIDVVLVEIVSFWQGVQRGIFAPISDLPNFSKMYEFAKVKDLGMQVIGGVPVVVYNEEVFKKNGWAPPKGFADLMRPEFRDKIALPTCCTSFGLYITIELARLNGGNERNLEPGFQALKNLGPVKWVETYSQLGVMMESGEAAIGVWGTTGAWDLVSKGVPLKLVPPDPVYLQTSAVGVMKNSRNPEGARALANWIMGDGFLIYRAEKYGEIPLNTETKYEGDPNRKLGADTLKKAVVLDYDFISEHRAEWLDRFTREVLRQ